MALYRERLWASPLFYLALALVIPASLVILAPISIVAGIITAIVLYGGCVALLISAAPTISIEGGTLHAGRATIDLSLTGTATGYYGEDATRQRGTELDARAWMLIRGWVQPVVKVPINDPEDPSPYWLLSTRHPKELVAAINGSRRPEESES
ncbi:DUF3093 domain-containing protein [Compostimonas suwonensis]|uniref:DUF3093 family protein n=1 Tax=Compostimonas suwonensis TaxID=1048394 RepID=A0A2M9BBL6_9MICO|nr:DUF3093 domain-containing protein [Compostimonas suwonensis]PJJ55337.1 Protein of unknown function (DUF3093) [Compostimonas suwonensis]